MGIISNYLCYSKSLLGILSHTTKPNNFSSSSSLSHAAATTATSLLLVDLNLFLRTFFAFIIRVCVYIHIFCDHYPITKLRPTDQQKPFFQQREILFFDYLVTPLFLLVSKQLPSFETCKKAKPHPNSQILQLSSQ